MDVQKSDIKQFLDDLSAFASRRLKFPGDLTALLECAQERHLEQVFLDAAFHAKFAVKTKEIMVRIGQNGEGYDKLLTEFQQSIEKTSALLKTLVKEAPAKVKEHFVSEFFALDQKSFANFNGLLEDLSWVKNWEVDGKPLPFNQGPALRKASGDQSKAELSQLKKSSILALALAILLLVIDPPVSYLGWGIGIVVILLLLYITLALRIVQKN